MQDVQNGPALAPLAIDQVGVRGLRAPIVVKDRARGRQHTVASVDLGADLPATCRGTHMSRFVEALADWTEELDYKSVLRLLTDLRTRLQARRAYAVFRFPFFLHKPSPVTGLRGPLHSQCELTGELEPEADRPSFLLRVTTPVMTVCPCSLAISNQGAHSQRAEVSIACRFEGLVWIEDLIGVAEAAASSPVYSLLKREDEKFVTEAAFANPTFVEDVARHAAQALAAHPLVTWFRVEVESFESIHSHNAYAAIERSRG